MRSTSWLLINCTGLWCWEPYSWWSPAPKRYTPTWGTSVPQPIRLTWFAIVFPALVLNYFGQGALLLVNPEAASHPFYAMVPAWAIVPTVLLATLATIIASQAVISGAFSMTRQAIQLRNLPRLNIRHTPQRKLVNRYSSGQLDAHGLHDLPCGRFSILQQTCRCIWVSRNLHDDH